MNCRDYLLSATSMLTLASAPGAMAKLAESDNNAAKPEFAPQIILDVRIPMRGGVYQEGVPPAVGDQAEP